MKTLLSTTALVLGLALPTLALAQTATDAPATETTGTDMPGFLAGRGATDIFASELMGHYVYARRSPFAADADATTGADDAMTTMPAAELDTMDNIGQINEIILAPDGQVRALVIGVGGFLGMGEQDVAVTMDQVSMVWDAEDSTEMYVIVNTGADLLKTSPVFDRGMGNTATGAVEGTEQTGTVEAMDQTGTGAATSDRTAFQTPVIERDGYEQLVVTDVSTEMLIGKNVYGLNDDSVGTIDDLLVDDKGLITNVIIDFGGFLGMGTTQVSVGYDEIAVLADSGRSDVRVYIDATKEQVQAQPQYEPMN